MNDELLMDELRPTATRSAGIRPLRRAAISLLAGFALTVAVSWGLSLWQDVSYTNNAMRTRGVRALDPAAGEGTGSLTVERFAATGAVFFETSVMPGGASVSTFAGLATPAAGPDPTPEQVVPEWIRPCVIPWTNGGWPPDDPVNYAYVDATGWPMLALWCSYTLERPTPGTLTARAKGAISLPGKIRAKGSWFGGGYPPSLPLRPRWSGLLVNSLFYAALVGALVFGIPVARRLMRRRAGRCERCGYDLRGTPRGMACPECGTPTWRPLAKTA